MEPILYKGVSITINNGGQFVAKIDELAFEKPSLAAMKKLIDQKHRRRKVYVMECKGIKQEFEICYFDTPEVIEHFRNKKKIEKDLEAYKKQAEDSLDEIERALNELKFTNVF